MGGALVATGTLLLVVVCAWNMKKCVRFRIGAPCRGRKMLVNYEILMLQWTDGHVLRCFLFSIRRTMPICLGVMIGSRTVWRMKLFFERLSLTRNGFPKAALSTALCLRNVSLEVFAMVVSRELSVNEPSSAHRWLENDTQFFSLFFWEMYLEMWFISSWPLTKISSRYFFYCPTWAEALIIWVNCLIHIFWAGSFLVHWRAIGILIFSSPKETYLGPKETYLGGVFSGGWERSRGFVGVFEFSHILWPKMRWVWISLTETAVLTEHQKEKWEKCRCFGWLFCWSKI